jgi:hypothetical protein
VGDSGAIIDPNYHSPYSIQASAGLEHAFTKTWRLNINYVHEQGVHQYRRYEYTAQDPVAAPNGTLAVRTQQLSDDGSSDDIADIQFHPTDSIKIISGSLNAGEIYYSYDGGQQWHKSQHSGSWTHVWPDNHSSPSRVEVTFAAADRDNKRSVVYASADNLSGEIRRSEDDGKSFRRMDPTTAQ